MRLYSPIRSRSFFCLVDGFNGIFLSVKQAEVDIDLSLPFLESFIKGDAFRPRNIIAPECRRSSISGLLNSCCPSAIFFTVIAIVVDAIKLQFWRSLAHVGKKIAKVCSPRLGNLYAASSVVFELLICWTCTAIQCAVPRGISSTSATSRVPMFEIGHMPNFFSQTPATFDGILPRFKIIYQNGFCSATITEAPPSPFLWCAAKYG